MKTGEIFVFGSNTQGRHGAGAAATARLFWGAKPGQARGPQGDSYAIVTKELRKDFPKVTLDDIRKEVVEFVRYAEQHPELTFKVTAIGCGLAGFQSTEISPLFAIAPENCHLPVGWRNG